MPTAAAKPPRRTGPLTEDGRALAAANVRLARWAAYRFLLAVPASRPHEDDVVSAAMYALVRAAAVYSPSRGKFSTLAVKCMWRAMRRSLCRSGVVVAAGAEGDLKQSRTAAFHRQARSQTRRYEYAPERYRVDPSAEDPAAAAIRREEEAARAAMLSDAIRQLQPRERTMFCLRAFDGCTLAEIGEVFRVSSTRVREIAVRAEKKVLHRIQISRKSGR